MLVQGFSLCFVTFLILVQMVMKLFVKFAKVFQSVIRKQPLGVTAAIARRSLPPTMAFQSQLAGRCALASRIVEVLIITHLPVAGNAFFSAILSALLEHRVRVMPNTIWFPLARLRITSSRPLALALPPSLHCLKVLQLRRAWGYPTPPHPMMDKATCCMIHHIVTSRTGP